MVPRKCGDVKVTERESIHWHMLVARILPPYLRKTKCIAELIPWLYLKGISTGHVP